MSDNPNLVGVIGGTGLDCLEGLEVQREERVDTPFGTPAAALRHGRYAGCPVVFLARHGADHRLPPHIINYRANLWALHQAGVRRVVAVAAVGGIGALLEPGRVCVPDQIIDYTWGRAHTFSDGKEPGVMHVDFTEPYSGVLRAALLRAGRDANLALMDGGVYGATQGPRLESAAEVRRLRRDGCDVVGMTGMPEAALARELGLDYACLAVVVNRAAGLGAGSIHSEIETSLANGMGTVLSLLATALPRLTQAG